MDTGPGPDTFSAAPTAPLLPFTWSQLPLYGLSSAGDCSAPGNPTLLPTTLFECVSMRGNVPRHFLKVVRHACWFLGLPGTE